MKDKKLSKEDFILYVQASQTKAQIKSDKKFTCYEEPRTKHRCDMQCMMCKMKDGV